MLPQSMGKRQDENSPYTKNIKLSLVSLSSYAACFSHACIYLKFKKCNGTHINNNNMQSDRESTNLKGLFKRGFVC